MYSFQGIPKMKENGSDLYDSKMKSTPIAMVAPELKQRTSNIGITKTCAVLSCDDSKNLSSEDFFGFPEDPNLRQIWTDLTGRNNWTPTDYSYICIQHFSVDCFTVDANNEMILVDKAVPSLKLPRHVLEVEYIDEETLDNEDNNEMDEDATDCESEMERETSNFKKCESEMETETSNFKKINGNSQNYTQTFHRTKPKRETDNLELLKLFTEVQMMQRRAVGMKDKLKYNMKVHNRQTRFLDRIKKIIETKRNILNQKQKKKARILLSLQDKIMEDSTGLVMAMPTKYTDDLKNFALSIYKYSPQAYVYARNSLRTLLPSTDVLDTWINSGYSPKNLLTTNNLVKVTAEQTESELSCKITLR